MTFDDFSELYGQSLDLQAGQSVFRTGERDKYIYVLEKGVLKALYLSETGNELIKSFVLPGEIIGSLASAHWGEVTTFDLIALETSVLICLDFGHLYQHAGSDLQLARDVIDRLLLYGRQKERRERELLTLSAEGRYRSLLDEFPSVLDQVKQKDIARFLGITPVALSRIRKKMSQRDCI
jgi:CRP-like cAMP-binding protein